MATARFSKQVMTLFSQQSPTEVLGIAQCAHAPYSHTHAPAMQEKGYESKPTSVKLHHMNNVPSV